MNPCSGNPVSIEVFKNAAFYSFLPPPPFPSRPLSGALSKRELGLMLDSLGMLSGADADTRTKILDEQMAMLVRGGYPDN